MEVSKVPIFRAIFTISSLSIPTTGRRTGRLATAPVTAMASMVWLATWPRHSPVTRALAPHRWATFSEIRIINRRITSVNSSWGQDRRSSSWMAVKGTTWTVSRPHQGVSSRAKSMTFSLASLEV